MTMRYKWVMIVLVLTVMTSIGCDKDERFAQNAAQAMESQLRQNEIIARQSEKVVDESRALAETAKELVAADSQSRGEMIQAQRELQVSLHQERVEIDRQRSMLEMERNEIAEQRNRDPIIAAALHAMGIIVACTLPLLLAGYALRQMNSTVDESMELGNLLIDEFTSPSPAFLSSNQPRPSHALPTAESSQDSSA